MKDNEDEKAADPIELKKLREALKGNRGSKSVGIAKDEKKKREGK